MIAPLPPTTVCGMVIMSRNLKNMNGYSGDAKSSDYWRDVRGSWHGRSK